MNTQQGPAKLYAFARKYAFLSLVAVLATSVALVALYRELSIRTIVKYGEQSNVTVAETTLNAMLSELTGYLRNQESKTNIAAVDPIPPALLNLIRASLRDTPIERIKIYNSKGIVLYSTREYEIGTDDSANSRFQGAIHGTVRSLIHYRDAFSFFSDVAGDDDNLIETYVPIRQPNDPRPVGVLEIYTDVDPIVRAMSHNALLVMLGVGTIMVILYGYLVYVVRRAERIIADQRQTILERNKTLEILSARMLHAEETERRRVALELHEEIAQKLSAVKTKIDVLSNTAAQSQSPSGTRNGCGEVVPLVQAAIGEVRALAMDLRPPDLDDFGLIATTRSLCREAEEVHGQLGITTDLAVREEDVPDLLKSVIFRITQQTLKRLVAIPGIGDIGVSLKRDEGLQLTIDYSAAADQGSNGDEPAPSSTERPMADLWERAVLAGGSFRATYTDAGRFLYQATWMV